MQQIKPQTAVGKVHWIGTIGPRWRYGDKEDDGQDPRTLVEWHHVTHDKASYRDLAAGKSRGSPIEMVKEILQLHYDAHKIGLVVPIELFLYLRYARQL